MQIVDKGPARRDRFRVFKLRRYIQRNASNMDFLPFRAPTDSVSTNCRILTVCLVVRVFLVILKRAQRRYRRQEEVKANFCIRFFRVPPCYVAAIEWNSGKETSGCAVQSTVSLNPMLCLSCAHKSFVNDNLTYIRGFAITSIMGHQIIGSNQSGIQRATSTVCVVCFD